MSSVGFRFDKILCERKCGGLLPGAGSRLPVVACGDWKGKLRGEEAVQGVCVVLCPVGRNWQQISIQASLK